ncbi:MAG: NAD(P)H-dependent glycerol-3-phosphate dehydrogenase, partial [Burkholderiales bacterium]
AKGIEETSGLLMTELLGQVFPRQPLAVLTGPSFAAEVARGLPTALTLATADARLGEALLTALGSRTFRPYLSDDPLGAQVGGALKNVIAIACGAIAGRGLGDNARAALVTRGLAELVRFGRVLGGTAETLMGLSGFGDLTLTCTSAQSRNYRLGLALGRGEIRGDGELAEGVATAEAALKRAMRHKVELPITEAVAAVLAGRRGLDESIQALLSRPLKSEAP